MSVFLIDLLSSADFGFSLSSWILGASDCLNSDDCCFVPSASAEIYQGPQNFGTVRFFFLVLAVSISILSGSLGDSYSMAAATLA